MSIAINDFKKNPCWGNIIYDVKVAIQIEKYEHWKFNGSHGYPLNDAGFVDSPSTYERVSWSLVGAKLLIENPFGYGLQNNHFDILLERSGLVRRYLKHIIHG